MIFLNYTIALLFVVMIMGKLGFINEKTTGNIFNGIYRFFTTLGNFETESETETESESESETEQSQEVQEQKTQEQEVQEQEVQEQEVQEQEVQEQEVQEQEVQEQEVQEQEVQEQEVQEQEVQEQEVQEPKLKKEHNENILPTITDYKYNPAKQFEEYLNKISNLSEKEVNNNLIISDKVLNNLKIKLNNLTNALTIKELNKIIASNEYNYTKQLKDIIVILGYKVPIINQEQKSIIINNFITNKVKFSRFKNGKAPFFHFYYICNKIIQDLNLPINIELIPSQKNKNI